MLWSNIEMHLFLANFAGFSIGKSSFRGRHAPRVQSSYNYGTPAGIRSWIPRILGKSHASLGNSRAAMNRHENYLQSYSNALKSSGESYGMIMRMVQCCVGPPNSS